MDLEEGSSRTGRGTKSLDSLHRYGPIVIRIDIQIQNFLQMSYDWCRRSRKNINISMVFWSISHAAGLSDCRNIAHWRSGNAPDFDSAIRGFESHMRRSASDFAFPLMQVGFSFSLCHLSQRRWLKELSNVPGGFNLCCSWSRTATVVKRQISQRPCIFLLLRKLSSVGQSNRLITGRPWVRIPELPFLPKLSIRFVDRKNCRMCVCGLFFRRYVTA